MLTSPLDAVEQKGGTLRNAKTTLMVKKDEMPPMLIRGHFHFGQEPNSSTIFHRLSGTISC